MAQKKIKDAWYWFTRLINTDGGPQEMTTHRIEQPASIKYKNVRSLFEEERDNPHGIIIVHRKDIKTYPQLKPADGANMKFQLMGKHEMLLIHQRWCAGFVQISWTSKKKVEQKCHSQLEEVSKRTWLCRSVLLRRQWGSFGERFISLKGSVNFTCWQNKGSSKKETS